MDEQQDKRLTGRELHALFDRLFPHGFAGADVIAEIAPEEWEQSPLRACFHPAVEQLFEERLAMHRNLEHLRRLGRLREGTGALELRPEPTLEDVRRGYEPPPVNQDEEVTELVEMCLWDIFSDNHDVIAADGRAADIGSFRGAGAFLDEYLTRDQEGWTRPRLHAVLPGNDLDLPARRPDARQRDDLPASQGGGRRLGV